MHLISLVVSNWKVNHPSALPNSKGSIEVHAMLKHAMVTSNVEAGIEWEITILMERRLHALLFKRVVWTMSAPMIANQKKNEQIWMFRLGSNA